KNGNPITYDVILDENGVITAVTTGNAYSLYVPATPINIIAAVLSMQNNLGGYVHNSVSINYIRGGSEVYSYEDGVHYDNVSITRGLLDNNTNNADNFQFIEYYFGAEKTNCSPKTQSIRNLQQVSHDTGYIRISEFSAISYNKEGVTVTTSASKEFALAMDMFKSLGKKYLILDLKENPGGDIEIAKEIASFLIYNKVEGASQKNLRVTSLIGKNINEIYTVTSQYSNYFDVTGDTKDTPHNKISILTDGNSASASELLTGAILSYGTGVQVGSTTYGKGIAQTAIPLTKYPKTIEVNGTQITSYYAIYLTIAKYYLPDEQNTNIHGVGLTPLAENIVESKPLSTDTYASLINKAQSLFVK
ncbi:MAG: S41 family peptidase, partial [Clostridia bacterium]